MQENTLLKKKINDNDCKTKPYILYPWFLPV